ncbi:hypothetical protein Q5752_006600 [Cryptotrichosporon argae]
MRVWVHDYVLLAHSAYFRAHPETKVLRVSSDRRTLKLLLDPVHAKPLAARFVAGQHARVLALADELGIGGAAERVLLALLAAVGRDPWAAFRVASQRASLSLARAALKATDNHVGAHAKAHAHAVKDMTLKSTATVTLSVDALTTKDVEGVSPAYLLGPYSAALEIAADQKEVPVTGKHANDLANGADGVHDIPIEHTNGVRNGHGHSHGLAHAHGISWAAIAQRFEPVS